MKSAATSSDKRKFSGQRVLARCEITLPIFDPFSNASNLMAGYLVFNMRGGCLYLGEHTHSKKFKKIFPEDYTVTLKELILSSNHTADIAVQNLTLKFLRLKGLDDREGIVFRFVDLIERQVDILFKAQERMPAITSREESSVPFEEVMTLDRDHLETAGGFGNLSLMEPD
ncbi:hypothetical protein [Sedimenticola hydrogenitrophicus]|uniref:hypothetical protein n=1 Tax=Sedimenticola hydrogenitrophicus TaxID=2967975 RepID=UPI0023AEEC11|nr:hypothetical protein [Sedimenticola hydrogenitrophicus]